MPSYVDKAYVDTEIQKFEANDFWIALDDPTREKRILWAEYLLNLEEYIGEEVEEAVVIGNAFPRNLLDDANRLKLLDTPYEEGNATKTVQRRIAMDHKVVPLSIKRAVVQLIVEWIEMQDYKDLVNLQTKAFLKQFEDFYFKEPDWKHNLPKSVWDIIAYLKPITWDEGYVDSIRVERS